MRLIREFEAQAKSTGIINLDFANEGGDAHKISVTADSFGDAGNDLSLAVDFIDQLPGAYHQASASGFAAFADVDVDLRDDMIQLIRFQANAVGPAANGTRVIVRHDGNLADNTAGTTLDGTTHILGINGTRTLTQLVAAFNSATETGWAVTASLVDSSQGGDTVEWLGGGVQAAVIYRLFSDAFLSFTAKDPGRDGNGIGVEFRRRSGNGLSVSYDFSESRVLIAVRGNGTSVADIAAAINAIATIPVRATAVGGGSATNRSNNDWSQYIQGNDTSRMRTSGGEDGPPPVETVELALGEAAVPGLTKYRFGQTTRTIAQVIATLNGIPAASKTMTAALAPGGVGNTPLAIAQRGTVIAAREVARVRLTGGEHNPNVEETLESEQFGFPFEILCGGRLVYTADMNWTTRNSGNVTLKLQKLLEDVGLPAEDVWVDWDTDNHTITLNGAGNRDTMRVIRQLNDSAVIAGVYRFRAVGSANTLRGTIVVKIDERASSGINDAQARTVLTGREGPI